MSIDTQQLPTSMRRELSLLLECARTQVDPATAERIRQAAGAPLDWAWLIETSLTHGLMPLLYENLRTHCFDLVPAEKLDQLKDLFQKNAARTRLLAGELSRILDAFDAQGIEAMPYKGPAIAVQIYGRLALRQFADLDILVRRRDVWRCQQILIARGYEPHFKITERQLPAFLKLGYVQMFTGDRGQSVVELHWAIASRFFMFQLDTDRFWERLQRSELLDRKILTPLTEDLLLLLCVHGAKDVWERLEWICAVAELLAHHEIDWATVEKRAKELRVQRIVWLGLFLAHDLFRAPLTDHIMREIEKRPIIESLAIEVEKNVLQAKPQTTGLRKRIRFHVRIREKLGDRWHYCVRLLFTTTPVDWQVLRLPTSLSFVYSLLRPFRLAKKYSIDRPKSLSRS